MSVSPAGIQSLLKTSLDPSYGSQQSASVSPAQAQPAVSPIFDLTTDEKLELWDQVVTQVAAQSTAGPDEQLADQDDQADQDTFAPPQAPAVPVEVVTNAQPATAQVVLPVDMTEPPAVSSASQQAAALAAAGLQPQALPTQTVPSQPIEETFEEEVQPSVIDQVFPQMIDQAADTLNPQGGTPTRQKELATEGGNTATTSPVEAGMLQQVETEKLPEIPVEVEGFLQSVEDHQSDIVHEVVIADGTSEQPAVNYPSRPVIVLPIDEEIEKKARFKGPKNSIRWLVEWSHKIIKMFAGKVIYRMPEEIKA